MNLDVEKQKKRTRRFCLWSSSSHHQIKMYNIVVHGIAFMVIFSAFQTASEYAQPILQNQNLGDLGFLSSAVIYISLSFSNLVAPAVVESLKPKRAMIFGASLYLVYLAAYLKPTFETVLAASVVLGFGGAILWTAQGIFLIENSNKMHPGRDSGIFWSLLQCRLLIGNGVAYITFGSDANENYNSIQAEDAYNFYKVLLILGIVGVAILFLLRSSNKNHHTVLSANIAHTHSCIHTFVSSICRIQQVIRYGPRIGHLIVCFCYTGLMLTFWSGKYFSLMHTIFGPTSVALGGISLGTGEIIGGIGSGFCADRCGRGIAFMLAIVAHCVALALAFEIFVHEGSKTQDYKTVLGYAIGFLLGLGDAGVNTAMYAMLGVFVKISAWNNVKLSRQGGNDQKARKDQLVNEEQEELGEVDAEQCRRTPLIALFKLVQSFAAAVAFFYSGSFSLGCQLSILLMLALVSVFLFQSINFMTEGYTTTVNDIAFQILPQKSTIKSEDEDKYNMDWGQGQSEQSELMP